jgi:hypothetical protein
MGPSGPIRHTTKGKLTMFFTRLAQQIKSIVVHVMGKVDAWVKQWTKPRTESLVVGTWLDM